MVKVYTVNARTLKGSRGYLVVVPQDLREFPVTHPELRATTLVLVQQAGAKEQRVVLRVVGHAREISARWRWRWREVGVRSRCGRDPVEMRAMLCARAGSCGVAEARCGVGEVRAEARRVDGDGHARTQQSRQRVLPHRRDGPQQHIR